MTEIKIDQNQEEANEQTADTYLNDLGLDWNNLKGKKLFDLGAGLAGFGQAAKKRGVDVVSLDAHPEWWKKEGMPPTDVPFVVGDGRKLPFKDAIFDMIVARASVHSIVEVNEDLKEVLHEARRVLKPGGEFRFGPGNINIRPVREDEWGKWFKLLDKIDNGEAVTPEENLWYAKIWPRYKQELDEEASIEGLAHEERIKKLQEFILSNLQSIDPTITEHPTTRIIEWKDGPRTLNDVYFIMKKPVVVEKQQNKF